jgi:hypothetical protein
VQRVAHPQEDRAFHLARRERLDQPLALEAAAGLAGCYSPEWRTVVVGRPQIVITVTKPDGSNIETAKLEFEVI